MFVFSFIRNIYDWMGKKSESPYAIGWLFFLFFIESCVFFMPVDPLLILFCVKNNKRSLFYASVATFASVGGGLLGYLIGAVMWQSIGAKLVGLLFSEQTFLDLVAKYKLYQNWAVLIAGFTPVPYKAVTLSAGFCHLPIVPFIWCSFLARGARFFLVAGMIRIWGAQVQKFIDKYFNTLVVLFAIIVILSCYVLI
jgi:membrane protein YqaA with SNARE-associated domain